MFLEILDVEVEEIASIEGFDMDVASEIKARAEQFIHEKNKENENKRKELGVGDELAAVDKITTDMLVTLGQNNIKTLDDLAELDSEELFNILGKTIFINEDDAGAVIMKARQHWFAEDKIDG